MKTKSTIILFLILSFSMSTFSIPLASATEDHWTTMKSMPTARDGLRVAVVNGKIYAIGGTIAGGVTVGTNEEYDPATNKWTEKTSLSALVFGFGIAVYDNEIYVMGGNFGTFGPIAINEVYNPITDTWDTKASMPTARGRMRANVVDGKIYVIGGATTNYGPDVTNVNEVYDPATNNWTTKTPIPTAVCSYASAVVDDKIYVMGGRTVLENDTFRIATNLNQIYNPETDTWSYGMPIPLAIPYAVAGVTTGVFAPKRIHVLGVNSGYKIHQVYDPEKDMWTTATPLPTSRDSFDIAVVDDRLYAIGGVEMAGIRSNANEQYTPVGYIPEFSSWATMLFIFAVFAVAVAVYKRRLAKNSIC